MKGKGEVYIHPNNLAEAYVIITKILDEKPNSLIKKVKPEEIIRSAYATLRVVQDEKTTLKLGKLKAKYKNKPWGDLSAAALSLRLDEKGGVPIVILNREKHFDDIMEVKTMRISDLELWF